MLLLIPSRKQCAGVDVSLCSLSIRLDSEVLTHPEIPIPMGTCPRKAGPSRPLPRFLAPFPYPSAGFPRFIPFSYLPPSRPSPAPTSSRAECPAINSAVSRYAQFAVALKYTRLQSAPADYNASRPDVKGYVGLHLPVPRSPSPRLRFPSPSSLPRPGPEFFGGLHPASSCSPVCSYVVRRS